MGTVPGQSGVPAFELSWFLSFLCCLSIVFFSLALLGTLPSPINLLPLVSRYPFFLSLSLGSAIVVFSFFSFFLFFLLSLFSILIPSSSTTVHFHSLPPPGGP
jgi:hypothetical protein